MPNFNLTTKASAELIGVTPAALRRWRYEGSGPLLRCEKGSGGRVMYAAEDVLRVAVERKASRK